MGLILTAGLAAVACGCGSSTDSGAASGHGGGAGSVGGSNGGDGNIGGNPNGDIGGDGSGIGGGNGGGNGGGGSCAGSTVKGEVIPLDMYIMLDRSGSMSDKTGASGSGPSKWNAVRDALGAFFEDPGSDELGVGLQFFPIPAEGVPPGCASNADCNGHGPCLLGACESGLQNGQLSPCETDGDCFGGDSCVPLGQCENNPAYVCQYETPEVSCGVGQNGQSLGTCKPMTASICLGVDSCATADYATPAVEIATLNMSSSALSDAIAGQYPGGSTPTYPALDGAVQHAKSWAQAHPDHKVIAVLATDGLPTECAPEDITSIAQIAAAGKAGTPSVLTFVIGVFGANDQGAQANLNTIAEQGGTSSAFFIEDNQDVTAAFLDALHAIQGQTLSCEYQIPAPPDGSDLDYGKVNVQYTPSGSATPETVPYVGKAADCDPMTGGWYYDKDPGAGEVPTKIEMCEATCSKAKSVGGQVEIQMGCQTIVPEPK